MNKRFKLEKPGESLNLPENKLTREQIAYNVELNKKFKNLSLFEVKIIFFYFSEIFNRI